MKPVLTPRELAEAIGVSESSLKRWADGLVRVSRTAGGHRRIAIAEAVRFIRETRTPVVRPELLGFSDLTSVAEPPAGATAADQLYTYLMDGRAKEVRGVVLSMYLGGMSVAAIADGPLHAAMSRIGEMWTNDERGIFFEHRASDLCAGAFAQLQATLNTPPDAPIAIGGAPPGDPAVLPTLVAATVLASEGFNAINLGALTPLETLRKAIEHQRGILAWLSISHAVNVVELRNGIVQLARQLEPLGARVVIGGHQHHLLEVPSNANVFLGHSMSELVAYARGLAAAHAATTHRNGT